MYYSVNNSELYHHGILGMKWGVRRYQPYPSDYSGSGKEVGEAAKARKGLRGYLNRRKERKEAKTFLESERLKAERLLSEELNKQRYEEEKQKALKSGSASDVLKFKGELTVQELQNAAQRIQWEKTLESYAAKDISDSWDKVNKAFEKVKKLNEWTEISMKSANNVEKFLKALDEASKKKKSS